MNEYIEKIVRIYFETNNRSIDDSSQLLYKKMVDYLIKHVENQQEPFEPTTIDDRNAEQKTICRKKKKIMKHDSTKYNKTKKDAPQIKQYVSKHKTKSQKNEKN